MVRAILMIMMAVLKCVVRLPDPWCHAVTKHNQKWQSGTKHAVCQLSQDYLVLVEAFCEADEP